MGGIPTNIHGEVLTLNDSGRDKDSQRLNVNW